MSKGTNRISVRMSATFRQAVEDYCMTRAGQAGGVEPWSFTDFVLRAIADKLNHIERSRRSNHKWKIVEQENGPPKLICHYGNRPAQPDAAAIEAEEWTDTDVDHSYVRPVPDKIQKELDEMTEE